MGASGEMILHLIPKTLTTPSKIVFHNYEGQKKDAYIYEHLPTSNTYD